MKYTQGQSNIKDVIDHLKECDNQFIPCLSSKIDIDEYSQKLYNHAIRFEAWLGDKLIGLVALYHNAIDEELFITNVSVLKEYTGGGIAKSLMSSVIDYAKQLRLGTLRLEVNKQNIRALTFYKNLNFNVVNESTHSFFLIFYTK